jgi:hypothetical protein
MALGARFLESTKVDRGGISARSRTPESFKQTISADIGESEAYKQALLRGEIGLQRPFSVNAQGPDFVTAVRDGGATCIKEVLCTDVKTSGRGQRTRFPAEKKTPLNDKWKDEVRKAVDKLKLQVRLADAASPIGSFAMPQTPAEITALEQNIKNAVSEGRMRRRQLNVNYSAAAQGIITGW